MPQEVAGLAHSRSRVEREEIIGTMVGLAYNYLEPEMSGQLMGVLGRANALENLIADTLVRGRAEGKEEGRIEGMRDLVRGAIVRRFGAPSDTLERRIASADERTLTGMLDRRHGARQPEDLPGD